VSPRPQAGVWQSARWQLGGRAASRSGSGFGSGSGSGSTFALAFTSAEPTTNGVAP
jgi:hypothetical protein